MHATIETLRLSGPRLLVAAALGGMLLAITSPATEAGQPRRASRGGEAAQAVELFDAIDKGQLEVAFIAADARRANVVITNKTDAPLAIALPEAFAGVPAQAQFGLPGGGPGMNMMGPGGGGAMPGGGGGTQGVGGGFPGGGPGGGGPFGGGGPLGGGPLGGGRGFFNVAPEKTRKIAVQCVCLEHGKAEPTARIPYKIVPIEAFTDDAQVAEVCKMLGRGEISQNVAQAAAWHLTDRLSWSELAAKNRKVLRTIGYVEKFFKGREIDQAIQATQIAAHRATKSRATPTSPGVSLAQRP